MVHNTKTYEPSPSLLPEKKTRRFPEFLASWLAKIVFGTNFSPLPKNSHDDKGNPYVAVAYLVVCDSRLFDPTHNFGSIDMNFQN